MLQAIQAFVSKYAGLFFANWQRALLGGLIVVSAVITIMGILKKAIIDRIPNKLVRKIVLAFSSVVLVFPLTALYFVGDKINFDHYWVGCALNASATIIVYWLYENTGCRNLFHKVGNITIGKLVKYIARQIVNSDNASTQNTVALQEITSELKSEVKTTLIGSIVNSNHDNDLDNL